MIRALTFMIFLTSCQTPMTSEVKDEGSTIVKAKKYTLDEKTIAELKESDQAAKFDKKFVEKIDHDSTLFLGIVYTTVPTPKNEKFWFAVFNKPAIDNGDTKRLWAALSEERAVTKSVPIKVKGYKPEATCVQGNHIFDLGKGPQKTTLMGCQMACGSKICEMVFQTPFLEEEDLVRAFKSAAPKILTTRG